MEEGAETRYALITKGLLEVLGEDSLKDLLISGKTPKVYWGTSPTGKPHFAYFLPMLKLADFLDAGCSVTVLLADLHAVLDTLKTTATLVEFRTEYYKHAIHAMLSFLGVDLSRIVFVKGSDFQLEKKYTMDVYRLSTLTNVHSAQRAGAQVVKQAPSPFLSGLLYPGMQALDEEHLGMDIQFGGADQRKIFIHAEKFLPLLGYKRRVHLMSPMVPGIHQEKMSSSDEASRIDILDDEKSVARKISKMFCEEGNVAENGVLLLAKFVLFPILRRSGRKLAIDVFKTKEVREFEKYEDLERNFAERKLHPGDLKASISRYVSEILSPIREDLAKHADLVEKAYPNSGTGKKRP